ncbi:VirB4 family type IV secretion system protein [Lactiplantibacillus plantarum]|uniref:VirB4 family type IV secretion system protein n=1 Tax=Lactiplantibacillus plantarum TaxID=1590 RepID=UPI001BAB0BCB|nr:hypothetical protein [Lactiplantibacillus plantarum]MBS0954950.1 hypothetical protein [Lactiplantibacillus plantarum]
MLKIFKRKKDQSDSKEQEEISSETNDQARIVKNKSISTEFHQPRLREILLPNYWSSNEDDLDMWVTRETVGHKEYGQNFYVPAAGFPRSISDGIFSKALASGEVEVTVKMRPHSRNKSRKLFNSLSLTLKANIMYQQEHNQTFQLHDNIAKDNDVQNILAQLQFNENSAIDVAIIFTVYGNTVKEMEQRANRLADTLADESMIIEPFTKRVKSGYYASLPIGADIETLDDIYRLCDRRGVTMLDTARSGKGRFNKGIPIGVNLDTPSLNLEFLNLFGSPEHKPINYNMGITGEAGAGKSVAEKVIIYRQVLLQDYWHCAIDPEGENKRLVKALHGLNLDFSAEGQFIINPLEFSTVELPLDEETLYDDMGELLSEEEIAIYHKLRDTNQQIIERDGHKYMRYVPINSVIDTSIDFLNVIMRAGSGNSSEQGLTVTERARAEEAMQVLVKKHNITNDPMSLLDEEGGTVNNVYYEHKPKPQPTLSELYQTLTELNAETYRDEVSDTVQVRVSADVSRLTDAIKPFLKGNSKPIFDGQTQLGNGSKKLHDYRFVNFNLNQLSDSLKLVTYFVITSFLWNGWMLDPTKAKQHKVIDADEILQFIDNPEIFKFYEMVIRRDRKRNGSLIWLTQDIARFKDNSQANALITNSEHYLLLKLKNEHKTIMQKTFELPEGVIDSLTVNLEPGEGVMCIEDEYFRIRVNPSDEEIAFAESNEANRRRRKEEQASSEQFQVQV